MQGFDRTEAQLRTVLDLHPGDSAAAGQLARLLISRGRTLAATIVIQTWFAHAERDIGTTIQAIEMLDACGRKCEAAALCEAEIAAGATDPRIHVLAGSLANQLGEFARARLRYEFVVNNSTRAPEWFAPDGLAHTQVYEDPGHPDFTLFQRYLERDDISPHARASLLFALGKASNDVGDYAQAADCYRQANALRRQLTLWSRKRWRRMINARLGAALSRHRIDPQIDWTPVFIVGVPRSGTTLLAEQLARHPGVYNRGELGWLSMLAKSPEGFLTLEPERMRVMADIYATHLLQDDPPHRFYIDKQPLNFLYLDLVFALWPHARVVYCRRAPRDTALSLWTQDFAEPEHAYASDFADIAAVIDGTARLMAHWQRRYDENIRVVAYEDLTAHPEECLTMLRQWLGLRESGHDPSFGQHTAIATASLWQARQPIYTHAIGRWRLYQPYMAELARFRPE